MSSTDGRDATLAAVRIGSENAAVRVDDIRCYLALRGQVSNAWTTTRFRRRSRHEGRELAVQLRDGPPIYLRSGTQDYGVFREIFVSDVYRLAGVRGWDCIVDLGGNVGLFAAYAAHVARRVIVYEPFADHVRQLRRNCAGRASVEIVASAVAGRAGTLRLYRPRKPKYTAVHSAFPTGDLISEEFDEVEAVTLDQVFDRHAIGRCDMLKIDVEGQEYDILHNTSDATLARIARIHGEYHDVQPDDPRTRIEHFSAFLAGKGYDVTLAPDARTPNYGMFFAVRC